MRRKGVANDAATNETKSQSDYLNTAASLTDTIGKNFMPLADAQPILDSMANFTAPHFTAVPMDITSIVANAMKGYSAAARQHLAGLGASSGVATSPATSGATAPAPTTSGGPIFSAPDTPPAWGPNAQFATPAAA